MKKLVLFGFLTCFVFVSFAQVNMISKKLKNDETEINLKKEFADYQKTLPKRINVPSSDKKMQLNSSSAENFNGRKKRVLTSIKSNTQTNSNKSTQSIWSNDFSTPADWQIGSAVPNNQNWVITTSAPTGFYSGGMGAIQSTSGGNFALFDSDALNENNTIPLVQQAYIRTVNSINLTGHPNVRLRFEQLYRKYQEQTYVIINTGAQWTQIEVNANVASNDMGADVVEVDISSIAGNQASVKIGFYYDGEWDYAWMVDDVSIEDAIPNDASTEFVYALGKIPVNTPHIVQAVVQNNGYNALTNLSVTLTVSGANSYTNTQTITALAVGGLDVVTFAAYTPTANGINDITVSVANDDNNANNSYSYWQEVGSTYAYADSTSTFSGLGYSDGEGAMLCKYSMYGSKTIPTVNIGISSDSSCIGQSVYALVLDQAGTIVGTSNNYVIQASDIETIVAFTITNPPTITSSDFYVGVGQTQGATPVAYYPLGTQEESYIRSNAYYTAGLDASGLAEATGYGRFVCEAVVGGGNANDIGVVDFVSPNNNSSCALSTTESVTVAIMNFGTNSISNFPVSYILDGGTVVTEIVTATISSGSTYNHTFSSTVDLSSYQAYNFEAYTSLAIDEDTTNDAHTYQIMSGDASITVNIFTDGYGYETYWAIWDLSNNIVATGGIETIYDNYTLYSTDVCVQSSGCYTFIIFDDYGDGLLDSAYYEILFNGTQVAYNGNFASSAEAVYFLGNGCPANDLGVDIVYTLGKLPKPNGIPHTVSAWVTNYGTATQTNVNVTLNITGANTFTDVQSITLSSNSDTLIEFTAFSPANAGFNTITVSVPTDENDANISVSYYQEVNSEVFAYADTSTSMSSVGYDTGDGMLLDKYYMNGSNDVIGVNFNLSNSAENEGNTVYAVVLDSDTNIVAQSANHVILNSDLGTLLTFDLTSSASFTNEFFFVGFVQTESLANGYFPLATQDEFIERSNAYYGAAADGSFLTEYTTLGRFMIEAVVENSGPGWVYTVTSTNHTILVPDFVPLTIDGVQIQSGDYIGVFYDSLGTSACGGFLKWEGVTNSISAWGVDVGNDGFAAGEEFTWKLWDATTESEYDAVATYNLIDFPMGSTFVTNGISGLLSLVALTVETQTINIPQGWSIFSTYIDPFEPGVDSVLVDIAASITIVKSGLGMVYWPAWGINNIGNLAIGEGYQIYVTSSQAFTVEGISVVPETSPITIPSGWSIMGYLRQSPADISIMLSSISSSITLVKNGMGMVYWPAWGINGIGNMNPGEGYQINVAAAQVFTFPANANLSKVFSIETQNEFYINNSNSGNNMTLGIPLDAWQTLPLIGDEIGVFNSHGDLVGSSVFNDANLAITIWGNDEISNNSKMMNDGETFSLKLWNHQLNIEETIEIVNWIEGDDLYSQNAISVINDLKISGHVEIYQNTPNPFSTSTEIKFYLSEESHVVISIYNILGEKLEDIANSNFNEGMNTIKFDAENYSSGNYFYKINTENYSATRSMSINR